MSYVEHVDAVRTGLKARLPGFHVTTRFDAEAGVIRVDLYPDIRMEFAVDPYLLNVASVLNQVLDIHAPLIRQRFLEEAQALTERKAGT